MPKRRFSKWRIMASWAICSRWCRRWWKRSERPKGRTFMSQLFPIAGITDEFSPDIAVAVESMAQVGMTAAELRMVFGKNIIDLTDAELDRAKAIVEGQGMTVISIA